MSWQHCEMSTAEMRLRDHFDTKIPFVFIVKFISLFCFDEILLHFSIKMICSDDFEDVIAGPSQKKKPFLELLHSPRLISRSLSDRKMLKFPHCELATLI